MGARWSRQVAAGAQLHPRVREDYRAVFWIEAGSKETIERAYIEIYGLLYGRSTEAGQETVKVEDAVPAVKRWFQGREGRWLVMLDPIMLSMPGRSIWRPDRTAQKRMSSSVEMSAMASA